MAGGSGTRPGEYVVYAPRSYRRLVRLLAYLICAVAGLVAVRLLLPRLGWPFATFAGMFPIGGIRIDGATLFLVALALIGLLRLSNGVFRRTVLLRVGYDGVQIDEVTLPWSSVGQFVIWYPPHEVGAYHMDLPAQVGVRLRAGAPLPDGMNTLVTDPDDPLAIPEPLRSKLFDPPLDASAVLAAARLSAPPDVELVERIGDEERPLPR